jgi:hypothetical protein
MEANKTNEKSGRETHANFDLGMHMLYDHASAFCDLHLRQACVILFHHVSFWGDYPAEIFIFLPRHLHFSGKSDISHATVDPKYLSSIYD